ncbi:PRD domain-containing protein [Corynebacterium guaraldiae]|uniref:PRD domain-containing protein n=1 Tax=Corynebacterium sp. HMSC068G04 TaxID=1739497 RepID=UPI000AFA8D3E|nr:PRD domain-containing protein [Corynebacterium sp. HMSC068G04]
MTEMKVLRALNNNVVLSVRPDGTKVVVTGWGVGFKKRPGEPVDAGKINQVFVPENNRDISNFADLLASVDPDYLQLAESLLHEHASSIGIDVASATTVALADHLQMAVRRFSIDPQIAASANPLEAEVKNLYPEEFAIGGEILLGVNRWLNRRYLDPLPESEAVAIALHLVNAGFRVEDLSFTYEMTELFTQLFDVIDRALGLRVDRNSVSAARFITHMRYFFVRVKSDQQLDEGMAVLQQGLETKYPEAVRCALLLKDVLELRLTTHLLDDEVSYLALHVARLANEFTSEDRP